MYRQPELAALCHGRSAYADFFRVLGRDGLKDRERPERRESRPRVAVVRRERKFLLKISLLHSCLLLVVFSVV